MYHLDKPDGNVKTIVAKAFPDYSGRKYRLSTQVPLRLDSYWDGGSITYYVFYDLATKKVLNVKSNHPFFEANSPRKLSALPLGVLLVAHSIFCGKDMGITIYANKEDITPMLPLIPELSNREKLLLLFTAALKNSYAGETNIRFKRAHQETGIPQSAWEEAKLSCISKGLLRRDGSITADGRNAIN